MTARRKFVSDLFRDIDTSTVPDIEVFGVCLDSRLVQSGDLYLCISGYSTHGLEFVEQALANGAVAVATDSGSLQKHPYAADLLSRHQIPTVEVPDLKQSVGALAARFYDDPSRCLSVVAVTGTDGKTSVCRFVADALVELNVSCGYIGTLGWGVTNALKPSALTTPDAVSLQRMLASMVDEGVHVVALEASSHGIAEGRLDAVHVEIAVLTNLGRDHLDYHGSVEAYAAAKLKLFQKANLGCAVVNINDSLGQRIAVGDCGIDATVRRVTFSTDDSVAANVMARNIQLNAAGIAFDLVDDTHTQAVQSQLMGRFNVDNLLACHAVLTVLGQAANDAIRAVEQVSPVLGRMETFTGDVRPLVVVDYAHTPQALGAALRAVKEHCSGQLWVVFGCGGDRDPGKRASMGSVAEIADNVVVTDDNPRTEQPAHIRAQIIAGMSEPDRAIEIGDRHQAIRHAIDNAQAQDLILVAGKGHEDYQIVGEQRLIFSDRIAVQELLEEAC
ncbi:MAG: UDP-N-acetylmuramoyl-L-alanyl-D-glutamate--2,6-diaminopimelate ligase [Gammaproteobacteria bacterium]|nr:UDP-N-acetylmuramoyl-L-alanyl-D-glutamate--2,6-diaminopimelate ligase [Gammaproteobacteria bacterium]